MIDKTEQTERTELTTKWKAAIAPPEELSIWEWADKNVILGQRFPTAYKGTYRSNLTPYLRGIMEALQDPLINTIVIAKGAQTGATLLAYIYILYVIVNDPSPLLLVMDSENNARSASEQRLIPLLEDTEVTRKELPSNPDDFKKLEYNLTRMNIKLTGANSAGNLASRSCRYLICDETDKYPPIVNEESDPISLAILRTKTFWNRKVILISTPTNEDGAIWKHYLQGNQCKYYIPCPNCKQEFIPEWSTIKFDKDKEPQDAGENAFIECPNCNNKIADKEKNTCIAKGKWKPTETPKQKGIASFHCPSILSPWTSISHLVTKFLMIEGFSNALKDFINGELGEPWKEVKEVIRDTELTKKQGDYDKGQLLSESSLIVPNPNPAIQQTYKDKYKDNKSGLIMTIDVQKDYLIYLIRQWFDNGDSALVEHAITYEWTDINRIADFYKVKFIFCDASYAERQQEVYESSIFCRLIPIIGNPHLKELPWTQHSINPFEGKARQKEGLNITTIHFRPDTFKNILSDMVNGRSKKTWLLYKNIENDYIRQMQAEYKVAGNWHKKANKENHRWDLENYQILGATIAGYLRAIEGG